jgi:hypothetical protein
MLIAHRPDNDKVEVTIQQVLQLLEMLCANDIPTAKMWLVGAIHQGKKDIREGKGVGPSRA